MDINSGDATLRTDIKSDATLHREINSEDATLHTDMIGDATVHRGIIGDPTVHRHKQWRCNIVYRNK